CGPIYCGDAAQTGGGTWGVSVHAVSARSDHWRQAEPGAISVHAAGRRLGGQVVIDRDTASRLGVSPQDIDNALYDAFGQRQVSTIYRQLNQYHVVMEVDPQYQQSPEALQSVYVRSSGGQVVPL